MKAVKLILCIIGIAVTFILPQIGFCDVSYNINVTQPAPAQTPGGTAAVEKAVTDEGKLASNQALMASNKALVDLLREDADATTNISDVQAMRDLGVTSPEDKNLAIGALSTLLAQQQGAVTEKMHNFDDTTVNPVLFSDTYVVGQTEAFQAELLKLGASDVAVIVVITKTEEEILKILEGISSKGSVAIVRATTDDSRAAFNALFEKYKEGFSLRRKDIDGTNVIKALKGTV